ncbi:P-loop NTPase [Sphingopyxis sp. SE2]|jgi:exopolysaccharide/PEP-CTERM locus tyrosine autokinase|uniref:P-loop NTPase n=1 Tax=unclassified Sphingopyxis TaxID=2614943 RepID=UPI00050DB1A0|nr:MULTISPECIES: P-loop NTPase [unclassified Sphingopyxis]KGB57854.1 Protein-tyrosine kinase [Sphingopyxis sp. LC363]MDT7527355.1 P-loop NTPase [Sphingopyxis sp. SE2]
MNDQRKVKRPPSLLERAADMFGLDPVANAPTIDVSNLPPEPEKKAKKVEPAEPAAEAPQPEILEPVVEAAPAVEPAPAPKPSPRKDVAKAAAAIVPARQGTIDRERLASRGMIVPGTPVTGIAEEYRIVKRELIRNFGGAGNRPILPRGHRVLIASANPGEGKTFSAVNLALSLAVEADHDVLLIDADIAKPSVLDALGLEDGPGLMDALADPHLPLGDCLIQTDIAGLKVMPAGTQHMHDTELLASARTETLLAQLEAGAPGRILILDSPPVLAASPAAVLAGHVGQTIMVVRADETLESALRDAIGLMGACPHIQLLLNGVKYSPGGRRFGTYYGQGGA